MAWITNRVCPAPFLRRPPGRAARSGTPSAGREDDRGGDQYQPVDSEWAQAEQGLP